MTLLALWRRGRLLRPAARRRERDFAACVVSELPPDLAKIDAAWRKETDEIHARLDKGLPARDPCPRYIPPPIIDPNTGIKRLGGMDFGFRDPFAALWGLKDKDDVLWLIGEHYERLQPLCHHVRHLPHGVFWYADPSAASDRAALIRGNFKVVPATNAIRLGITAVTARIRSGGLKILAGRCPHLLAEAGLYRWADATSDANGESPEDDHNHAMDALRYLVMGIDERQLGQVRVAAA